MQNSIEIRCYPLAFSDWAAASNFIIGIGFACFKRCLLDGLALNRICVKAPALRF